MSDAVWRPWDTEDAEDEDRRVLREGLPPTLLAPVLGWLHEQLNGGYDSVHLPRAMAMQSALRVDLGVRPPRAIGLSSFISDLEHHGPAFLLRVVDFLLASWGPDPLGRAPADVGTLAFHFDANASVVEVGLVDGVYRLRRRLPDGIELAAQEAVDSALSAGPLLARAWRAAHGLEARPSEAMQLTIRAVEAAARPVVIPDSKRGFLGEIAQVIEQQDGWELVLRNEEGYPDQKAMLALMLRTLAKAQGDRHGVGHSEPTSEEARAHVQLGATLVGWFASGAIRRRGRS